MKVRSRYHEPDPSYLLFVFVARPATSGLSAFSFVAYFSRIFFCGFFQTIP